MARLNKGSCSAGVGATDLRLKSSSLSKIHQRTLNAHQLALRFTRILDVAGPPSR